MCLIFTLFCVNHSHTHTRTHARTHAHPYTYTLTCTELHTYLEPPAWEAPAAQISQRAPSQQGRGRLAAKQPQASNVIRLEIKRVKRERGQGPWPPPQCCRSAPQCFMQSRSWLGSSDERRRPAAGMEAGLPLPIKKKTTCDKSNAELWEPLKLLPPPRYGAKVLSRTTGVHTVVKAVIVSSRPCRA